MSVYKKRPELLDLLRRRGVSFTLWCSEFGLKSWDDVVAKCREIDVIPPNVELAPLTSVPIVGFSESAKAQMKEVIDAVHDAAELKVDGGERMKYEPEVVVRLQSDPVADGEEPVEVKTTRRKKKTSEDES